MVFSNRQIRNTYDLNLPKHCVNLLNPRGLRKSRPYEALFAAEVQVLGLGKRGINIVAADLDSSEDELAKLLQGLDVVIAAVNLTGLSA